MASIASLSGTPGLGSVNSAPPFSFKSSSAVKSDYGSKPSVSALMNPTLHNNVPEPMVNSTARAPIFARPFQLGFEKHYSEGDLLFVQRDDERSAHVRGSSQNVVANLPVVNFLLREQDKDGEMKYQSVDAVIDKWNYLGVMNNDMDTGSKWQRLLNVNVRGRTRVARLWDPDNGKGRLKRGDQVWLALVERKTGKSIKTLRGPNGVRDSIPADKSYFEFVPTMDCCADFMAAKYLFPIGIVSQVTLRTPHRSILHDARYVTEKCKLLERIEILMRI